MIESTPKHKCSFCGREFVRERTLISHMCEMKRRFFNKNEKYVIFGYNAWKTFYIMTGSAKTVNLTYKDFMESKYYLAFTKFGKHIIDINMVNPELFIRFVIKNHIKLDDWCKDSVYAEYVKDVCRREDVNTAMERQIKMITKWADETNEDWRDFFSKVEPGTAYKWIMAGRLSPWLLLNSKSAEKNLFPRFSDEQLAHIVNFFNMDYWKVRMAHDEEDTKFVKNILEDCGL